MQFKRLRLQNFRLFVDEEIHFSVDKDQNVTVIHGQNGSGKTTILHALRWVLFGEAENESDVDFDRFPNQGQMAITDVSEHITVCVELDFINDGTHYALERWASFEKQSSSDFKGTKVDEGINLIKETQSGQNTSVSNPNAYIKQLLPKRLSNLFFFDGEYINQLGNEKDQDEIKEAIENVMGLEILDRAIGHLESVEDRFEDEMKEHGSEKLQELVNQKRTVESEIDSINTKIQTKRSHRNELQTDIDQIDKKLEEISDVAQYQQQREHLQEREKKLKKSIVQRTEEIQKEISQKGYLPFVMAVVEDTAKDIDKLRKEGKIPSELDNRFIESLLDEGACICGRPIKPNTESYNEVASYKSPNTPDGVDHASLRLISHIGTIQETRKEFFETVEQKVNRRNEHTEELTDVREELDEISEQIRSVEKYDPERDESPQELEQSRREKIKKRAVLKEQISQLKDDKNSFSEELNAIEEDIDTARNEKKETDLARKRMKAAQIVRKNIEVSYEKLQQQVRKWSNERVGETFDSVSTKSNYVAAISDDFELTIREGYGGSEVEVNKSRGERQIASLAFIGSLVSIAKERYESNKEKKYFAGGIYPIMMDSPFGSLDKHHRKEISRVIPKLADQVIILVTDSQWEGPVENEMTTISGAEYQLIYHEGVDKESNSRTRIEAVKTMAVGGD